MQQSWRFERRAQRVLDSYHLSALVCIAEDGGVWPPKRLSFLGLVLYSYIHMYNNYNGAPLACIIRPLVRTDGL